MSGQNAPAPIQAAPIAAGALLVGCGALLLHLKPHLLALPRSPDTDTSPGERLEAGDRVGAAAQTGRDTLLTLMPPDLLTWLGRVLMLAGTSVVVARLLDLLVERRDDRS